MLNVRTLYIIDQRGMRSVEDRLLRQVQHLRPLPLLRPTNPNSQDVKIQAVLSQLMATLTTCGAAGTQPKDKKAKKMMSIPTVLLIERFGFEGVFLDVAAADPLKMKRSNWIKSILRETTVLSKSYTICLFVKCNRN